MIVVIGRKQRSRQKGQSNAVEYGHGVFLKRMLMTHNQPPTLSRFVSETVALQTSTRRDAVAVGPARRLYARIRAFDEFAAQVARHVHPGTSLLKETIERVSARKAPDHLSIRIRQRA
jgi:hypothetical protein